jgi:hypothetical protein
MRDFYRQYDAWILEPLRRDLPSYVHYRNYIRGYRALAGNPAMTRLREHSRGAHAGLLARLERFASYEVVRKILPPSGSIRLFGREAHLNVVLGGVEVAFYETLEGLEARVKSKCLAILRDYRTFRQLPGYEREKLPPVLYFEPYRGLTCPRIAVAHG